MTANSETAVAAGDVAAVLAAPVLAAQVGEVREIPLNRLKASPRNARRVGHPAEVIEARAASIRAKGVLQPLVVEPEVKNGRETGSFLVSIGEGRRQALRLLAKRKLLPKTTPVRCVVDTTNDPAEISLDENVSREGMHPADAFEAFRDLSERRGWSAEEIGARFGVKPDIVRQRLRLGAVAPALLDLYREGGLTLEQVIAFAVNPDVERQMQVFAQLLPYQRATHAIRRAMVEDKVAAADRRAAFVGLDAYVAAGGPVLRDLFTEAGEGWLEDVGLLDRLAAEKLAALATGLREAEGWKWTAAYIDYPHGLGLSRIWEKTLPLPDEEAARRAALLAEREALIERWPDLDDLPADDEARLSRIDADLDELAESYGFDPAEKAFAGALVVLGHDGEVRIERGFVRPEEVPVEEEAEEEASDEAGKGGEDEASASDGEVPGEAGDQDDDDEAEAVADPTAPLSAWLKSDLTAHRTAALRLALAQDPDLALVGLLHVLVCRVFGATSAVPSCLDVRIYPHDLNADGQGIEDSPAGVANAERHAAWAAQMPRYPGDLWDFVVGMDGDSRLSLLAHCVGLSLNAVHGWERRPGPWAHADQMAAALSLDMADWWTPTAKHYLGGATKGHILAAVAEAVSPEAAVRLAKLKKTEMTQAAEPQLVAARWLPALLRTPGLPAFVPVQAGKEAAPADEAGEDGGDGEEVEGLDGGAAASPEPEAVIAGEVAAE